MKCLLLFLSDELLGVTKRVRFARFCDTLWNMEVGPEPDYDLLGSEPVYYDSTPLHIYQGEKQLKRNLKLNFKVTVKKQVPLLELLKHVRYPDPTRQYRCLK